MIATAADPIELIENFDRLPGAALVAPKIAAAVLGVNERTLRRHPPFPRIQVSERRFAFRVADIRALGRSCSTVEVA